MLANLRILAIETHNSITFDNPRTFDPYNSLFFSRLSPSTRYVIATRRSSRTFVWISATNISNGVDETWSGREMESLTETSTDVVERGWTASLQRRLFRRRESFRRSSSSMRIPHRFSLDVRVSLPAVNSIHSRLQSYRFSSNCNRAKETKTKIATRGVESEKRQWRG